MSDFDKEAEREKLRKKYEQDQERREATEKMSELLLQGATMTNAHCSECGDPVFRYDGQEFCASCEKPVDRENTVAGDETDGGAAGIEVTEPSDDARVSFGGQTPSETGGSQQTPTAQDGPSETEGQQPETRATTGRAEQQTGREQGRQSPGDTRQRDASPTPGSTATSTMADGDLADARASLVRTLERFSQQAEACEDPKRAQEYLVAAREAAATLDELRR